MGADDQSDPAQPDARADVDGADPQEEADVAQCDAAVERCEFRVGELDGQAHEAEFTIMDELHQQMRVDPIQVIPDPVDGLPHPVTGPTHFAPPFTHETMVCIEDERTYVEVFADELVEAGWQPSMFAQVRSDGESEQHATPDLIEQMAQEDDEAVFAVEFEHQPRGSATCWFNVRSRFDWTGAERTRRSFDPSSCKISDAFGLVRYAKVNAKGHGQLDSLYRRVPVRPIRERCKHYKRMCVANDDQPDREEMLHYIRFRNCVMRRSVGGAFLSLRDEAVYACDYRDPPDEPSVAQHLDGPDNKKLVGRPDLVCVPLFGLEGDVEDKR